MKLDVCFTLQDFAPNLYQGWNVVVIDVFRATTVMITALQNGGSAIYPVATVEAALQKKMQIPGALLAGERQGVLIAGFDKGNSPLEFDQAAVAGREIIMTTTNGTAAVDRAASCAATVFIAGVVNMAAVCRRLQQDPRDTVIICSGTEGKVSLEDIFCGGGIVHGLGQGQFEACSDQVAMVELLYREARRDVMGIIGHSAHGETLRQLGLGADIALCLAADQFSVVPYLQDGRIRI